MPAFYHTFLHSLFVGIIALFPVVNPIGSAFIISPYFTDLSKSEKRKAVGKIALYAFCICTVSLFAGHWILELFGISIPIIQLAGGIMICKIGWEFLTSDKKDGNNTTDKGDAAKHSGYENIENKLFYPITFPITTGAGTISVLFTLSADSAMSGMKDYYIDTGAILLSIVFMCMLIYIFYLNTKTMIHYLGANGEVIFNRIIAFLIFCVGLQIAVTGIKSLIK
jgi:multiple antibiotic resistance protein